MEAALLLYDWFRNNRASLRDQTSQSHIRPAAEHFSRTPSFLASVVKREDRRETVEFSDDQDRGGPLASGDVTLVRISEATVHACKQSAFCVGGRTGV